jgi:predicted enzyme related to lactoylglutathione lyase
VEDCRKTYQELKSRGVEFKQVRGDEVKETPYGIIAMFADPDGNLFELDQVSKAVQASWKTGS